jgi:hypothetical protein
MPRRGKRAGPVGRRMGVSRYKDPASAVFDNLEAGASIDEIIEQCDTTREQINVTLEFVARSLDAPAPAPARAPVDAHSV